MKQTKTKLKTPKTLADLIADDKNANAGTARGREVVQESLRSFGAGRSVLVDRRGRIVAGNKTVSEAQAAGIDKEIVVIQTTGRQLVVVQRTDLDLDSPKGRQLALADNRTSELGLEWDSDILKELSTNLDLKPFFTDVEMTEFLSTNDAKQYDTGQSKEIEPDDFELSHQCPKCGFEYTPKGK